MSTSVISWVLITLLTLLVPDTINRSGKRHVPSTGVTVARDI